MVKIIFSGRVTQRETIMSREMGAWQVRGYGLGRMWRWNMQELQTRAAGHAAVVTDQSMRCRQTDEQM